MSDADSLIVPATAAALACWSGFVEVQGVEAVLLGSAGEEDTWQVYLFGDFDVFEAGDVTIVETSEIAIDLARVTSRDRIARLLYGTPAVGAVTGAMPVVRQQFGPYGSRWVLEVNGQGAVDLDVKVNASAHPDRLPDGSWRLLAVVLAEAYRGRVATSKSKSRK